jgi:lipoprotein-releasing system permease protein
MFYPLELFVGLRYLRARRRNHFVSFISIASLLGIALGVAALIVVLSVMNGFEGELRERLLSMTSHASVSARHGGLANWKELLEKANAAPEVVAAAPFVELEGMLTRGNELAPSRIRGIAPELETGVSRVGQHLLMGELGSLEPGKRRIILGKSLAMILGVNPGDPVTLMVPEGNARTGSVTPRLARFVVSGIFEVGLQEQDSTLALINLEDAAAMAGLGESVTGIRLEYRDIFRAPVLASKWVSSLGDAGLQSRDWSVENASYFRAIAIEKTMMSLILMLVVAVAAFNIVSSLVMLVSEKKTDIAILRTVGLSPGSVVKTFMIQGSVLGWAGTILGIATGVALAKNLNTVVPALESFFGFEIFPSSVYYITSLPSDLRTIDVLWIGGTALVLTLLATIYPARRAAAVEPAEALRYE